MKPSLSQSSESLDQLALRHETDKSSRAHEFAAVYDEFLAGRRNDPIRLLEIGIYKGASLRMWRDYFPRAHIAAVDSNEKAGELAPPGVPVYIGDQANAKFVRGVAEREGPFDVIVDDGGHRANQQIVSLKTLWPYVRPTGLYVIEDIHTSYLEKYEMGWRQPGSTVELLKYVIDDVHEKHHGNPVTLTGIRAMHVYPELCILSHD